MFRFVHAADLHLDSPMRGLPDYEGAPIAEIRGATRAALMRLVDRTIAERADFLLIAGDVFDGDWRDISTGLFFAQEMSRLRHAGIPVFLIRGNHDAQSRITSTLTWPDNVTVFSAAKPATVQLPTLNVAIHGQSFANPSVSENLAEQYPPALPGWFNIGLLHTSLDGREGHAPYAPCTTNDLLAKNYDYWALGHCHAREIIHAEPPILFAGNMQGRHINEADAGGKGATLVTVDDGGGIQLEHLVLDTVRWQRLQLAVDGIADGSALLAAMRAAVAAAKAGVDEQILALRLELTGRTALHHDLCDRQVYWRDEARLLANDIAPGEIWLERLVLKTQPELDATQFLAREDTLGDVARALQELAGDVGFREELQASLKPLVSKLSDVTADDAEIAALINDQAALDARLDETAARLVLALAAASDGHD